MSEIPEHLWPRITVFALDRPRTVRESGHEPNYLDDWAVSINLRSRRTGSGILVLLDDENPFLSEDGDVFIAEHASSAASADGWR